jgi:hypothetical protein
MSEEQPKKQSKNEQPGNREGVDDLLLNEAVEYLQSLRLHERPLAPDQLRQAVSRLLATIRNAEKTAPRILFYRRAAAAAVILFVLAAGLYGGRRWLPPRASLQTA